MSEQKKKYDAICIGQIVQDILVTDIPEDALTCGQPSIDADQILMAGGGDAINEAATLARLGNNVALLGRLDQGDVGNMICGDLDRCGIKKDLLIRPEDCQSVSVIVVVKPNGEHSFFLGKGKNDALQRADIDLSVFHQARAVLAGSLYILGELDTNGIVEIFREAKAGGAITVADMTYDSKKLGPHAFDDLYPYVDYCMPSYEEANYITGETEPDAIADAFLKMGAKHVLIKLGSKGCFFKDAQKRFYTDPFKITPVDTTGCGDNFVAAFTHCLLKGMPVEECAEFASAAGALNSQGLGAHMTVMSEEQVLEFMKKTPKVAFQRN